MAVWLTFFMVLFIVIVVAGWLIPRQQRFTVAQEVAADKKMVFNHLDDAAKWQEWSAWSKNNDAQLTVIPGDKSKGRGASFTWNGPKMGKGEWQIEKSEPYSSLLVTTQFKNSKFKVQHQIQISGTDTNTRIDWVAEVKTGWSSPSRILGKYMMKRLQKDIQTGLIILQAWIQSGTNRP